MDTNKAKLLQRLEKGKGAQEVEDTDKLPGTGFKRNENDMFKKLRKAKSGGGNEIECPDRDALIFPDKKKKRLGASSSDSENADKQKVQNETVHEESEESERNEESSGGEGEKQKHAKLCAFLREGKELIKKNPVMAVATFAGATGLAIGYGAAAAAKKSEESSGRGKKQKFAEVRAAFGKAKEVVGKNPVIAGTLVGTGALGITVAMAAAVKNSEKSRSSDSGKANQVTQKKKEIE